MLRSGICLAAALLVAGLLNTASAQTTTAPAATAPAPAVSANKTKLKACRVEVKRRGLAGDDRWFFIEDCMDKTRAKPDGSENYGSRTALN